MQGLYTPNNPEKYLGDISDIIYRSSWELEAFIMLDNNPNILVWGSEIIQIPYMKLQTDGSVRPAIYYPDLYVEYKDRNGNIIKEVTEIKPLKQTKKSRAKKIDVKMQESFTLAVNQLKWNACEEWCEKRGIVFSIATEKSIFR